MSKRETDLKVGDMVRIKPSQSGLIFWSCSSTGANQQELYKFITRYKPINVCYKHTFGTSCANIMKPQMKPIDFTVWKVKYISSSYSLVASKKEYRVCLMNKHGEIICTWTDGVEQLKIHMHKKKVRSE